ncbi:hypothetical protein M2189_005493 [Bradyrhizobium japonicum]|uniref:hypothetical protein n=1 Tax=Bradyrhizobium japonicum TaxID=375 RepID=UPI002168B295|nr:hypothetical protein [Bradyrhizobium japonicum]MCS3495548.1 hypothetical protein [Bradyrhizobium japonicum]MCS3962290.1 hypothetical protein [Bradyrhizobium japonicum]MCS3994607.1 hypothetical protein [Bradyrhizobium japonicum]
MTTDYLASAVRVNRSTIVDLESGKRKRHEGTLFVLLNELSNAGIVFTETGVQFRK